MSGLVRIGAMKRPSRPRDTNQLAKMIVDISTGEAEDEAVEETAKQVATRKSGEKGGKVRAG